jgi:predicted DNA-binding transcriptional regulator AlpA
MDGEYLNPLRVPVGFAPDQLCVGGVDLSTPRFRHPPPPQQYAIVAKSSRLYPAARSWPRRSIMSDQFPLPLPFLRTQEAARFIGLSRRTLEKHRIYGTGPKYSKIGGRIVYAVSDLREWVELGAKRSTSDPSTVLPAKPAGKRATKLDRGVG